MKFHIDAKLNVAYISLKKGKIHETLKINPNVLVDLDKKGNALGFEILDLEKAAPLLIDRNQKKKSRKAA